MNTIVTIDFDIIMAPSINLYNNLVPSISWEKLEEDPYFKLLKIDGIHYQKIVNYIIKCMFSISKERIHFIEDHGQAVRYIKEKCDLINIDHHHDIGYGENLDIQEMPTCANWAYYLYKNNLINSYTWINNNNSEQISLEEKLQIPTTTYDLHTFNLDSLKIPNELIICLSEPWTPPYIRPLFYTIMDICNRYYNTHFDLLTGPYLATNQVGPKHS